MSLSDIPFAYGPFVPHYIPRQYVEGYFSAHKIDSPSNLSLNTTVEDVSFLPGQSKIDTKEKKESWKLTLRKYDILKKVDIWWEETFDAGEKLENHFY